jgi:hypothetical protein
MTLAMDDLLAESKLTFEPRSGAIEPEQVASAVAAIGFSCRDEHDPTVFVIFPEADMRDAFREARRADPSSSFPYVPLITVAPDAVVLFTESGAEELRPLSAAFITWMMSHYDCEITNEFGSDMAALPSPEADPPESAVVAEP